MNKYCFECDSPECQDRIIIKDIMLKIKNKIVHKDILYEIELGITEACTNIVRHAYGFQKGKIRICIYIYDFSHIVFEMVDWGKPFCCPECLQLAKAESESGRGIFIIKSVMDQVDYSREKDKNKIRMLKKVEKKEWKL